MARPRTLTTGRAKPIGEARQSDLRRGVDLSKRRGLPGLVFTRVRGVRKLRAFASAPRNVIEIPDASEYVEVRYKLWERVHGGTRPEFTVFDWLERKAKMKFGVDFLFQSSRNGGRSRVGGSIVDFEIPRLRLFFRVQGERFHLSSEAIATDTLQKVVLSGRGYKVVDIWPLQLAQATDFVMESALRGVSLREVRG